MAKRVLRLSARSGWVKMASAVSLCVSFPSMATVQDVVGRAERQARENVVLLAAPLPFWRGLAIELSRFELPLAPQAEGIAVLEAWFSIWFHDPRAAVRCRKCAATTTA